MLSHHSAVVFEPACGLLLVGHGSRDRPGNDEFLATAGLVAELASDMAVEPSFLEFAEPSISQGFNALVRRGVQRVVVVPVLLFSAGHLQRDIPSVIAVLAAKYPDVSIELAEHLGGHAAILELSKSRYDEALLTNSRVSAESTALVIVGRGSHDPEATAEMFRFVELRQQRTPVASARACFIAMAEPRLDDVLQQVIDTGPQQIVVQPHLLFGGVLLDRVAGVVEHHAVQHRNVQWVTTGHLGVSRCVVQAVVERASQALADKSHGSSLSSIKLR